MSREGNLAKNSLVLALGTFLPKLVSFITLPIITGYLSKEEYGTYDLILVLVSLVLPIATLQIQTAAFRFLVDVRKDDREIKRVISNIFAFILPVSIVALIILFFVMRNVSVAVRICVCLYFLGDILVNAVRQIVRGLSRNLDYSISAIISSVGQMLLVVLLVYYYKTSLLGSIIALAASEFIAFTYLFLRVRLYRYINLDALDKSYLKEMLGYSWPMVPNSLSMWVMRLSDRLVLVFFMGTAVNAVYGVANKIPQILTLAQSTFSMAWQENASIVSKDKDADQYYSSMFGSIFNLMVGLMSLLIGTTPILFRLLIRGDYDDAYNHIPILLMAMLFYSCSSFMGGIYVAFKHTKSVGMTTLAAAVCNLLIDLSCIHFIGIYAASLSTLISYILLFVFRMLDVRKFVNIKYETKHIFIMLAILSAQCGLCMLRMWQVDLANILLACYLLFRYNKPLLNAGLKIVKKKLG